MKQPLPVVKVVISGPTSSYKTVLAGALRTCMLKDKLPIDLRIEEITTPTRKVKK